MANGLTDSDLNRQRLGFGVSPDTASRRRAVEAGVAPLTTGEQIRRDWGWGPSTPEEQVAFQAAEVIERGGPIGQMPVEYGGRPTGTSRRALRMQAEYDTVRQAALENQRLMEQADLEQRRFELSERNQTLQERQEARLQAAEAKAQDEDLKVSKQADFALNEVLGGFDPTGNPVSGLDPDAPDYMQRRNDIIKRYPKALKDDAFKAAIATTDKSYFDTENFNQQLQVQQQTEERMLGKEQRMEERQREARKEERGEQKESLIVSQEREIQRKIREQNEKLRQTDAALAGRKSLSEKQKADLDAIKNGITDLRIEKADLRGLVFETEEEADAANPPSGSTIYIGRKPFKVP
jgi:hypothetical protein